MNTKALGVITVFLLVAALGCRAEPPPDPSRTRFTEYAEALYRASKALHASLLLDHQADRLRPLIEACHREFSLARDWAMTPEQKKLVAAYGDALPAARTGLFNLVSAEGWAGIKPETHEAVANIARQVNEHNQSASKDFDWVKEKLQDADALFVKTRQ